MILKCHMLTNFLPHLYGLVHSKHLKAAWREGRPVTELGGVD